MHFTSVFMRREIEQNGAFLEFGSLNQLFKPISVKLLAHPRVRCFFLFHVRCHIKTRVIMAPCNGTCFEAQKNVCLLTIDPLLRQRLRIEKQVSYIARVSASLIFSTSFGYKILQAIFP